MDCAHCELGSNWGNLTQCFPKENVRNKVITTTTSNNINDDNNRDLKNPSSSLILLKTEFEIGAPFEEIDFDHDEMDPHLLQLFEENMIKNTFKYTPQSISILINFGVADKHVLYSSDNYEHNCSDVQLYDPFSDTCRTVFCNSKFDLDGIGPKSSKSHHNLVVPTYLKNFLNIWKKE